MKERVQVILQDPKINQDYYQMKKEKKKVVRNDVIKKTFQILIKLMDCMRDPEIFEQQKNDLYKVKSEHIHQRKKCKQNREYKYSLEINFWKQRSKIPVYFIYVNKIAMPEIIYSIKIDRPERRNFQNKIKLRLYTVEKLIEALYNQPSTKQFMESFYMKNVIPNQTIKYLDRIKAKRYFDDERVDDIYATNLINGFIDSIYEQAYRLYDCITSPCKGFLIVKLHHLLKQEFYLLEILQKIQLKVLINLKNYLKDIKDLFLYLLILMNTYQNQKWNDILDIYYYFIYTYNIIYPFTKIHLTHSFFNKIFNYQICGKMKKVENNKIFTLLTGAAVLTGASVLLFRFLKKPDGKLPVDPQVIDRETIIKILKELKKELFTVFQNFAAVAINIKQQSMGRARPEDIKMMLLEQPMFRGEIEQVEEMVYSQFKITKQQVEHYCQNIYRDDPTIKELQKQMKESFDRSFAGLSPDPKTDIPAFLTADTTFEILEKVMTESALKLNEKLLELQEKGEQINFQSPRMMEIMQSLKMDSSKKQILEQYGLNKFEDPGSKILQYATQVYSQQPNNNFTLKMKQLDMKYQSIMEQLIMQGPMSNEELKQRMEQVSQQQQQFPFQEVQDVQAPLKQQEQVPIQHANQEPIQDVHDVNKQSELNKPVNHLDQHEEQPVQEQQLAQEENPEKI